MRPFDPASALGPRLREVREERGLAVRELARRIGCSASLISQVERGISSPSAGMLYALATELQASLDYLFDAMPAQGPGDEPPPGAAQMPPPGRDGRPGGQEPPLPAAHDALPGGHGIVQRISGRRAIDLASGVRWERLTPCTDNRVDFLEVIYEPDGHSTDSRRAVRHDGYEYGVIISGILQANVGFELYELGPGDSVAFDSATPHEYWNRTSERVHAIWVVVHSEPGLP
ncbi:MAG TPA: XRE family transcriptional regulator [Streptosporangiaceae bacterium]|jgi:transcriptional regulator with XRE-family HTH domain/mannose-6-phosphate isomerase-like protein (cupin superfamily)|nr:XRE family transcriptional regulator [Streptosporangiaceae bacterium]